MATTNNSCDQVNQPQTFDSSTTLDHITFNGIVIRGYQKIVLTSGGTVTVPNNKALIILTPASSLGSGTLILPSAPNDGQYVRITTTQLITIFSLQANTGQTLVGSPVSLGVNVGKSFIYTADNSTWYPVY